MGRFSYRTTSQQLASQGFFPTGRPVDLKVAPTVGPKSRSVNNVELTLPTKLGTAKMDFRICIFIIIAIGLTHSAPNGELKQLKMSAFQK